MIDPTYFDVVLRDHAARVEPINQTGWQRAVFEDEETRPTLMDPSVQLRPRVRLHERLRSTRHLNLSLVRRLIGLQASHPGPLQ